MMEVKFQANQTDFFKKLRFDVNAYFREKNLHPTGGTALWVKAVVISLALAGIYVWLVAFQPYSWWICMSLYLVLGVVIAMMGFNLMHDGSHGSFSQNKFVNKLMAYSLNVLGGNSLFWNKKHNINHHTYTNIEHVDDDIDLNPFMRMHSGQKKRWFHRYQHFYAIFLYGLTYLLWIYFLDFKKYFTGRITPNTLIPKMKLKEHLVFWLSKILHLAVFVLIPVMTLGLAKAIVGYLTAAMVTGFIIAIIFQLAHIVEDTHFTTPSDAGLTDIKSDWAVHQVRTTVNFATHNKVLTWFIGGLNYQMVHHLFPKISHVHYPAIRPIILATCRDFNLPYTEYPRMTTAIRSHLRHLKKTGRED